MVFKHSQEGGSGWGEVVLNRPGRKNAIVGPLGRGLADGIRLLDRDEDVQAIVLSGAGGSFCSGLDLTAFNDLPEPEWLANFSTIWRDAHRALFECVTPIIGAMERYAINGGAALAIACDYLVVGEKAFLQVGEVQIGMAAPYNMAWLNLRHSESATAQITLIGDRIQGPELQRLGYSTACNEPFSGTIVPLKHYRRDQRVESLMIEINRNLYLNEDYSVDSVGLQKVVTALASVRANLAKKEFFAY